MSQAVPDPSSPAFSESNVVKGHPRNPNLFYQGDNEFEGDMEDIRLIPKLRLDAARRIELIFLTLLFNIVLTSLGGVSHVMRQRPAVLCWRVSTHSRN